MYMTSFEITGDEFVIPRDSIGPNTLNTSTHKSRILALCGSAIAEVTGYGSKECVAGEMFPENDVDYNFPNKSDIRINVPNAFKGINVARLAHEIPND